MRDIRIIIKEKRSFYNKIKKVSCPVLGTDVHFTSEGFNHLLYNSNNKPRNVNDRYMRLMCLAYAPEVVKKCTNISEIRKVKKKFKGKLKDVVSYELVYVKGRKTHKVIVQRIGMYNRVFRFASVMPLYKRAKYKKKRSKKRS